MKKSRGFTMVEVLVLVVVIGLIAAGGYLFYANQTQPASTSSQTSTKPTPSTPAVIQSNADLNTATADLNTTNIDNSLDTSLNQLDQDSTNF